MSEAEIGILATKLEALEKLMVEKFLRLEEKFDLVSNGLKTALDDHIESGPPWKQDIETRLKTVEERPGLMASSALKWLLGTVGVILIGGALTLVLLGIFHTLEATPNIGNEAQHGVTLPFIPSGDK